VTASYHNGAKEANGHTSVHTLHMSVLATYPLGIKWIIHSSDGVHQALNQLPRTHAVVDTKTSNGAILAQPGRKPRVSQESVHMASWYLLSHTVQRQKKDGVVGVWLKMSKDVTIVL
jgi:hypothetical protein